MPESGEISLRLSPQKAADITAVKAALASKIGVNRSEINDFRIIRRSIDARQRNVVVNLTVKYAVGDESDVCPQWENVDFPELDAAAPCAVIVGAGPAGLFAALKALELGIRPIVLERGKDVDSRRHDIAVISREGLVDPDSNYCFGEGGAGTFSDGKLFTRSRKRGNVSEILGLLHQFGASADILVDAHPHIGSDRLPSIIKNIRHRIIECGGQVEFNSRVERLFVNDGAVEGVVLSDGREYMGPVVLATGHSARDVYRFLQDQDITVEAKGLAIGVRLEHPQKLIDSIQYHSPEGRGKWLPAAEYSFVTQSRGRGVYSFCMCPGGVVVPAASGPGQSVVNGMSASARASRWANSGMVVELHPGDIPGFSGHGELEMLALQEHLEKTFFDESGGTLNAPAQRMRDFVEGIKSETLPDSSYAPGIHSARLDLLFPEGIATRLREGFTAFGRKSKGFLTNDAVMIGLESRTSSPVRIPRHPDTLEHVHVNGLYPAGEGAGYAGGIVSAAIDGQNCMISLAKNLNHKIE